MSQKSSFIFIADNITVETRLKPGLHYDISISTSINISSVNRERHKHKHKKRNRFSVRVDLTRERKSDREIIEGICSHTTINDHK